MTGVTTGRRKDVRVQQIAESMCLAARSEKTGTRPGNSAAEALVDLATALQAVLAPVNPPPAFREGLGRNLSALARHRVEPEVILQGGHNLRRSILIGAALSSLLSLVGLAAILLHRRLHRRPHTL